MKSRLVMLSGPSGVGKGMVVDWLLKLFHPELFEQKNRYRKDLEKLCVVPVYKSKKDVGGKAGASVYGQGNGENPYRFDCRGVDQEIDVDELDSAVESHKATLIESYYQTFDFLRLRYSGNADFASIFISPLDSEEIGHLREQNKTLEDYLPVLMNNLLVDRTQDQGDIVTPDSAEKLAKRAKDSVREMRFAHNYRRILSNHCYEPDPKWKFPYLIGEPLIVVRAVNEVIKKGNCSYGYKGKDFKLD